MRSQTTACTLVEGGLILGRVLQDATIVPRQVLLFRDFVRVIFTRRRAESRVAH